MCVPDSFHGNYLTLTSPPGYIEMERKAGTKMEKVFLNQSTQRGTSEAKHKNCCALGKLFLFFQCRKKDVFIFNRYTYIQIIEEMDFKPCHLFIPCLMAGYCVT